MPAFKTSFKSGAVLDVQEVTGDFLDTTMQSIGSATVSDDGMVEVVAQRVGRFLLIPDSGSAVGVIVRNDGRHTGPVRVSKEGKWAKDAMDPFERLDAPLNTEQSEAQTGDQKGAPEDLGDVGDVEQPPLPEDQPVTEKELKKAVAAREKATVSTEGMTAPAAASMERAAREEAKAEKAAAKKK